MNTISKWQDADVDSTFNPLDNLYYNRVRRKGALPERANGIKEGGGGFSNSTLAIGANMTKSHYDANLRKDSLNQVSEERREYVQSVIERMEGNKNGSFAPTVPSVVRENTRLKNAFKHSDYDHIVKTAVSGTQGLATSTDTLHIAPELYSPLFLTQNLQLPRDIITGNAWNRAYYETNPIVRNAINLHATYPISKMNIKCEDKKIEQFFKDMMEKIDLETIVQFAALEFWKLGEKMHKNSLVTMSDGSQKRIVDVQIGDMVLTHKGNKKRVTNRWAKPTNVVIEEDLKIYKITMHGLDEPLIISGRHPILSKKVLKCKTPSCVKKNMRILPGKMSCGNCGKLYSARQETMPDFVEPNNVEKGDLLYSPFDKTVHDNENIDNDFAYLIGKWLAEGCYCKAPRKNYTKYNGIKFCSYDSHYIYNVLEPLLEKVFGHKPSTYVSKSTQFAVGKDKFDTWLEAEYKDGPKIANFFKEHCGEYSKEKRLSEMIMMLPVEKQLHLLAGFIDGDGCVDKQNNHIIMCTSSKNLASQFMMILRRAGARPSVSKVKSRLYGKHKYTGHYNYRVKVVANEAYELFSDKLLTEKKDLLAKRKWCSPRTSIQDCWQITNITKIEDITDEFNDPFMYDIEVEDDHSYIANGVAVHNCFVYAEFDETNGVWSKLYLHNPDFVSVKASPIPGTVTIALRPDPELEKIITSNDPSHVRIRESLDPRIVHHVLMNEYIPLDSFNISHLKNLSAPYDVRGTSLIVSVWKDLMLYDKLRESKIVQADGMINPLTLVKVGASNPDGHYPTREELETYREILEQAQYDKDFKMVTHDAVDIQRIGYNGAVLDTSADFQFIIDNILMGLMVPKAIITQEGATYASASVALDVMRQRYNNFRTLMANWLEQKIFAPISEVQGFYKPEGGVKRLIVPQVEWNHMTLYDLDNYLGHILGLVDKKKVSVETVYRSLGLNKENEMANIRGEQVQQAILEKEAQELGKMSLTELRSLDPKKPIPEKPDTPLPGTPGGPGGPEDLLGGGPGGGLDLGAPPSGLGGGGLDLGGPPPGEGPGGGLAGGPDLGPGGPGGDLTAPPPGGDLGGL